MKTIFPDFATVSRGDIDLGALQATGIDLVLHDVTSVADLPSRLAPAEILITNKIRIGPAELAAAPGLKLICLSATGVNNVDLEAAGTRGIGVCNITAYCTASVVQHVYAMILALTHHLAGYQRLLQQGAWKDSPQFCLLDYPIRELAGRKLGIVGYGELGRSVAGAAAAFGLEVIVSERPGNGSAPGPADGIERLPFEQVLAEADILSLHCPLTDVTRGLIDAAALGRMKNDAILINTARGALVDSAALAAALRDGRIAGAGIDVLPQEPPVDGDPLLDAALPNLVITPHVAWAARESRQRAIDEIAANIQSFMSGGRRGRVI
ncbi:D-2-hydroxyacid dehydrogenase [Wenzhouxiangella sp. XN24]|uniref:D-2-hydroxyacid dehydrogenase n=1 Tax=Wenzhouxiangella sp. XN24 TaxID=2713569 RepID=UPI0013EBA381|nr:D-2-hydroxyacid dehydrogenase [Wenzhouxiangella sp. XN24]NGX17419.1 D-2-hydroxyacid dehydrogenase [Wenzhouxiangella sp. XN24]